jgi:hypothetical protein
MTSNDYWIRWHSQYDDPESPRSYRLAAVQRQLRSALDQALEGPIRLISMCAGQGRDVLGVLAEHPRSRDVRACLVELSRELASDARARAAEIGLADVTVMQSDASWTSAYADFVPADVILTCGVFGSISQHDMKQTILELPHLGGPGAITIWTKEGNEPDLRSWIRGVFREAGFEELAYETAEGTVFGVGSNRWTGAPLPFRPDLQMFFFRPRE